MQQLGVKCLAHELLNSGMRDEQVWEDQRPNWGGGSSVLSAKVLSLWKAEEAIYLNYFYILFDCDH